MKRLLILLALPLVAGCAIGEKVLLKNTAGMTVQCGPYTDFGNIPAANETTAAKVRDCVTDYQRQGYERVPGP